MLSRRFNDEDFVVCRFESQRDSGCQASKAGTNNDNLQWHTIWQYAFYCCCNNFLDILWILGLSRMEIWSQAVGRLLTVGGVEYMVLF